MQARINSGEAAQQKLELQLSELQPHAAKLEESLQDSQAKLKTTQSELAGARAEHAQTKVSVQEGTVLCRSIYVNISMTQAVQVYEVPCDHLQLLFHMFARNACNFAGRLFRVDKESGEGGSALGRSCK